jgi:hypothetical protein
MRKISSECGLLCCLRKHRKVLLAICLRFHLSEELIPVQKITYGNDTLENRIVAHLYVL